MKGYIETMWRQFIPAVYFRVLPVIFLSIQEKADNKQGGYKEDGFMHSSKLKCLKSNTAGQIYD